MTVGLRRLPYVIFGLAIYDISSTEASNNDDIINISTSKF